MISFVAGKLSCLYTSVKLNFEGSFGWSRKESLYYFARQRGPQRANTLRTPCPNLGRSVQFSCSVASDSLQPRELQRTRLPCPSPTPRACSDSGPSSQWCWILVVALGILKHCVLRISSSVVPFSFCLQSFPESGSFPVSQFFAWGGQSIGVSASASVLPVNIQDWSPLGWTGWISLQSKGLSRVSPTPQFKSINSLALNFIVWLSHNQTHTVKSL